MSDRFNTALAERHADRIREFWAALGFKPRVWVEMPPLVEVTRNRVNRKTGEVEQETVMERIGVCGVRSDMIGGQPRPEHRIK